MLLNRFPVEYQMDSQDCGPACLKIIAKHFGKFYSLQSLRDRCGITKEGVSLLDLSTGAVFTTDYYSIFYLSLIHISEPTRRS